MSQEVLDSDEVGIGIEKLRCHRMPEVVTGDRYTTFLGIVFDPFLYSSDRYWFPFHGSFLYQEQSLCFRASSFLQVRLQGRPRILARVHNPIFTAFSVGDEICLRLNSIAFVVSRATSSTRSPHRSMSMNMARSLVSLISLKRATTCPSFKCLGRGFGTRSRKPFFTGFSTCAFSSSIR